MRLATYEEGRTVSSGFIVGDTVRPLPDGLDTLAVARLGVPAREGLASRAGAPVPLDAVRLLPPVVAPSVRDFVTFEEHMEGMRMGVGGGVPEAWYELPTFYFSNPHALIGAHDDVPIPPGCSVLDFELEVGAVIGFAGADLTPEEARSHIAGYTIFNDWSARDLQSREMQVGLGPCKGKDTATTLGPWLVTADELEPYRDAEGYLRLAMSVSVNGVEVGRDLLSNMGWPFEVLVAYASRGTSVLPGDVLGSGTCGNGGCLAELWGRRGVQEPAPLQAGDVVSMTVEGIGTIANRIVAGVPTTPLPRARARSRERP